MNRYDVNDYPPAMKNLSEEVRGRAIAETNALLDAGYAPGRAISMGIAKAQEADERGKRGGNTTGELGPAFHVMFSDPVWVIWPEDRDHPTHRFNAYDDALRRAHELASDRHSAVYVFDPDGKLIERSEEFGEGQQESNDTIAVSPANGDWVVRLPGPQGFFERCSTKREAVELARRKARELGCRLVVRYQSGDVQTRQDFGSEG
jgi:hypothetical protein